MDSIWCACVKTVAFEVFSVYADSKCFVSIKCACTFVVHIRAYGFSVTSEKMKVSDIVGHTNSKANLVETIPNQIIGHYDMRVWQLWHWSANILYSYKMISHPFLTLFVSLMRFLFFCFSFHTFFQTSPPLNVIFFHLISTLIWKMSNKAFTMDLKWSAFHFNLLAFVNFCLPYRLADGCYRTVESILSDESAMAHY